MQDEKKVARIIRGAGGGKGGGGATIASDTLASRAYAQVVIAVCEGEVEGLVGGMQGVYLDGTALENPDGTFNYTGVSFYFQPGTQSQPYVPGFSDVENETAVNLVVLNSAPLVRTISDENANAVRVTVNLPDIYYTNTKSGDVTGSSVDIAIDIQTDGSGYVQRIYDTISGKSSSNYERSYVIGLQGTGPWDIRVRRVTPDSTTGNPVNVVYWTSFTEMIYAKLSYPNTAVAYISVDSGQFQSIPALSFNMRGLRIQVPSNYDPSTRTYSGAWDGTFKIAYSNNPAWCFYDLLTATRYGLGNFISASQVDKWALYQIGQYCDQFVPDGYGGYEPRFTLNCYIQNYADAFKVLQDLASAFRGMPFWSTGAVTATQDAPAPPVALFTPANVIDGQFTYTGASLRARHTVALVTWYNMDDQAQPYVEYVSISDDDIAKYGEIITQVTAFGCTSRGQANRLGKWILYSEKYEGETVAFKTGLEGTPVRPGDIIKIADPVRAGLRLGGRINAATAYSITVDSLLVDGNGNAVNPVGGTLSVIATDGSVQQSTVTDTIAGTAISIFSRASIGTYIDSTGILRTAAANVPRLDYSTGTEAVLIEAAATNYNTAPNSVSVAYGSPVIASNAVTAPDGTMTATRIMFSGSSGAHGHIADASFPLPGPGTISLWLRADVACQQHLYFSTHNSSGTQVIQSNFLINLTTSWKRFSISASAIPAGYTKIQWQINEVTATNIYVWGGQTEAATSSSSFIPTVGSVASRAADVATMSLSASQTLVLSAPFAVTPQAQAMWILELPTIEGQLFRIIQSTRNERNEFTITAMAYNASKYGYIDYGTALVQQQITDLTQPLSAPASLECTESLYSYQGTIFSMASLGWAAVAGATAYLVGWAKDSSNMNFATVPNNQFDLSKTDPGLYLFQVWTIGPNQRQSTKCVSLTQQLYGKTLPPSDVVGLTYGWDQNNGLVLSWAQARDVDLYAYEIRAGQNWADATVLGQSKTTTFIVGTKFADQTFWVAVLDTQGVYSVNPQSVSPVLPSISAPKVAAEFVGVDAVISWAAPTSILAIDHYIISLDGGLSALAMVSGTTFSRKAIFSGTNIYSVAAVDIAGNVGAFGSASLTMVLPAVNSITDQVVDNNVLLYWKVAAGTLPIDHYIVAEGYSWATAQMLGQTSGTFDTIFETAAGLKSYWICAVDAAGNRGVPANLSVYVNPPPDYVLHYNLNSTFGGNRTNIATDTNGTLLAPVDTVTTYQAHFANKSWSSPNDQVNAGFPLFIEPALLSASYVEIIDYGSILPASSVLVTLSSAVISGAPVVSCTIAVSADNSTWTTYANTTSVYVSNFRYARITISVSGTAGLDILQINALNIKYQVKQKTDSGTITCNFGDSNGTPVQFNMSFIDVTSISVTPNSTMPCFAIYNFSGDADPTGFTIMLFDTSGNRISGSVSWSARGV